MRRPIPIAVLATLAAGAAPAGAATVSTVRVSAFYPGGKGVPDFVVSGRRLVLTAAPGEASDLSVTATAAAFAVRDQGAPLAPGDGDDRADVAAAVRLPAGARRAACAARG